MYKERSDLKVTFYQKIALYIIYKEIDIITPYLHI